MNVLMLWFINQFKPPCASLVKKSMKKPKLFKPYVSYRAIWNIVKTLLGTQLAEGPQVKAFEDEFGRAFGKENVVALNSGTSALELAYELAGIKEGDEVITPVLTCTATNIPLVRLGAKIVFADIDYDLNINIQDVKNKITKNTKAIVFVHFGGNNRGLDEIIALGKERSITIIEDAAQAVGSKNWGRAEYTAISLQSIKTLTSGDGGFLICKSDEDYKKARRLRWFGYDREEKQKKGDTDIVEAGYKMHMNDITAAIGRGNLASLDKILKKRKKLRNFYNRMGEDNLFNLLPDYYIHCHNWLCIQFGVKGEQHHYRNDKYTIFKDATGGPFPVLDEVEKLGWRLLPFHHDITIKQAYDAILES